jgi:MFS family permease
VEFALTVVVSFIALRIVIGFFAGGMWPTAAVSAMEELEATSLRATRKRTRASAIMQSGYHSGHLIAAFIFFFLLAPLAVPLPHGWPVTIWHNFYSFNDAYTWRTLCFIGGVFGIAWTIYFSNSEKNEQYRKINIESPLKALLFNEKNKEYRGILFNFWLVITGLLYMYYSVIVILPEMLVRNNFLIPYHLSSNDKGPLVTILILVSTLGAHVWLGFYCHSAWKSGRSSVSFRYIVCILMELRKFWCGLINKIANFIGIQYAETTWLDNDVIYKNVDIMIIVFIGFILIIFGILGGLSFYFLFNLFNVKPESILSKLILIFILVFFIMIGVSGWALIPSLLSSRFPKHIRATASNLAYNDGLAIGFASPFIMLENFLNPQQQHTEWLIFLATILAAFAMIIGATRLLLSINKKSKASRVGL